MGRVKGIVYCITNVLDGRIYIGSTIRRLASRKSRHMDDVRHGISNRPIVQAMQKFGEENFVWTVIEKGEYSCIQELRLREANYIVTMESTNPKKGFNKRLAIDKRKRPIRNKETGIVYTSVEEAARMLGVHRAKISVDLMRGLWEFFL